MQFPITRFLVAITCFTLSNLVSFGQAQPLRIWYDKPAAAWEACVPLGNGKLGAMPDGGIFNENITLNDITLWSGSRQDADMPNAYRELPQIQALLLAGKNIAAQELMAKYFVCKGKGSGEGNGAKVPYGSFEILGNLQINYQYGKDSNQLQPQQYTRQLSLNNATVSTAFSIDGVAYKREYFTSFDDDVVVIRLSASQLRKLNFSLTCNRPEQFETNTTSAGLLMKGQLHNGVNGKGMQYNVRLAIKAIGGMISNTKNTLRVQNANSAVIYIAAGTNYKDALFEAAVAATLRKALKKPVEVQHQRHIKKFQSLFNKVSLKLDNNQKDSLTTPSRLAAFTTDRTDNGLAALYFQYGRYLLISSTRPGLLPPNLQGLWANSINTPWNGDYHININLQMNHWPLEVTNLAELNEPFLSFVKHMVAPGERTAKAYYNAEGWVAHVITNIWQYTSPGEHYSWGSFNTGSAWLCQMLWSHYEFTKDSAYLRKLYPILKGSATFYAQTLIRDSATGYMVTAPSNSPENAFVLPDGKSAHVCMSPTIDNQLLRFLFTATIEAAQQLNKDRAFCSKLQQLKSQLPPNQIAKDGRLMEWLKEYPEAEPKHRHISHLWGLHPGYEINETTPELQNAAKASLYARGDEGTGWSIAWKINFWARLQNGNKAMQFLQRLLKPSETYGFNMVDAGGTYANLFCAHPPFQIDGNFGGTAGIAEMLLQSHSGYIQLLPALPQEWKDGSFDGLCTRGGAELSISWANSMIQTLSINATADNTFRFKVPAGIKKIAWKHNGTQKVIASTNGFFTLHLKKGEMRKLVLTQ